jgi:hypothetical protein
MEHSGKGVQVTDTETIGRSRIELSSCEIASKAATDDMKSKRTELEFQARDFMNCISVSRRDGKDAEIINACEET